MGMKDDMIDEQNEKYHGKMLEKLATILGITDAEVQELDVTFDTEQSNEGADVNTIVNFGDDANPDVLDKIKSHTHGQNFIFVGLHALDPDDLYNEDDDMDNNPDGESGFIDIHPDIAKGIADEGSKKKD